MPLAYLTIIIGVTWACWNKVCQKLTLISFSYVAAKSNYFGVGGGTEDFKEFLDRENIFEVQDSHTVEAGW